MARLQRWILPVGLGLAVCAAKTDAHARARHLGLTEAVEAAEAIAVIHTNDVASSEVKGDHWTYSQRVMASTRAVIKGSLTSEVEILAEKNFTCARVHYDPNTDYLVVLVQDGGHWTTLNHGWGALRIDESGSVSWPYGKQRGELIPLAEAIEHLRRNLDADELANVELLEESAPTKIEVESEVEPEVEAEAELQEEDPAPCGLLVSYREQQDTAEPAEETGMHRTWLTHPVSMLAGAAAMFFGFVTGWRRRKRR